MRRLLPLGFLGLAACASEASAPSILTSAPATEPTPPAAPASPTATPPPAPAPAPAPAAEPSQQPSGEVPVVTTKRVFVTSASFSADLKTAGAGTDGFDGADRLCTKAASAAGLAGTFRAFLSGKRAGAEVAAASRAPQAGAWVGLDGQLAFLDRAEMTGSPRAPIAITETMQTLANAPVWTGTNLGALAGTACEDAAGESWSSSAAASSAVTGLTTASMQWTFAATSPCNATAHLYCFEE